VVVEDVGDELVTKTKTDTVPTQQHIKPTNHLVFVLQLCIHNPIAIGYFI
jgi:hypothetical protein